MASTSSAAAAMADKGKGPAIATPHDPAATLRWHHVSLAVKVLSGAGSDEWMLWPEGLCAKIQVCGETERAICSYISTGEAERTQLVEKMAYQRLEGKPHCEYSFQRCEHVESVER